MATTEDRLAISRTGSRDETRNASAPRRSRDRHPEGSRGGLTFQRRFTRPGVHPYDEVEWELRTATISGEGGEKVFEQTDVEIPAFWSQQATKVVVSKYFRGHLDDPRRERSVKQLISRVAETM